MKVVNEVAETDEPKETKKRKTEEPNGGQTGTTDHQDGRKGNGTFEELMATRSGTAQWRNSASVFNLIHQKKS